MIEQEYLNFGSSKNEMDILLKKIKQGKYIPRKDVIKTIDVDGKKLTIVSEYEENNKKYIVVSSSKGQLDLYIAQNKKVHKANEDDYENDKMCKIIKKMLMKKSTDIM